MHHSSLHKFGSVACIGEDLHNLASPIGGPAVYSPSQATFYVLIDTVCVSV